MNKRLICIIISLFFFIMVQPAAGRDDRSAEPVQILCLGDSITQANDEGCGYRYALWKKLIDDEILFDLIGSMDKRFREEPGSACPAYKGRTFDPDHEGHWAWRIDEILGKPHNLPLESGTGNLAQWLKGYTPDIVLLHLGHNDAGHNESAERMAGELKQVIHLLQQDNPAVTILLAKVIPCVNPVWNTRLNVLNSIIDGVAVDTQTATSKVMVIDQATGFDPLEDTLDNTHPNARGAEKMAKKWMAGIKKVLDRPSGQ